MNIKSYCLAVLACVVAMPVMAASECKDEQERQLTRLYVETLLRYPTEPLSREAVGIYSYIIETASRPRDEGIRFAACQALASMLFWAGQVDSRPDLLEKCPADTVDRMLVAEMGEPDPNTALSDDDYLPIVRVAPVYPKKALKKRLSGSVTLSFTVTPEGRVDAPRVTDSTDPVFERASLGAVKKFKYKPRVLDGVPVAVPDVRTRISFTHPDDVDAQAVRNPCE